MQPSPLSANYPAKETCQPTPQATCPVCSGGMFEFRGTLHCSRCHFSLCEGCEVGGPEGIACPSSGY
jgi:hypothetical protein